jgi:hypothetical protein
MVLQDNEESLVHENHHSLLIAELQASQWKRRTSLLPDGSTSTSLVNGLFCIQGCECHTWCVATPLMQHSDGGDEWLLAKSAVLDFPCDCEGGPCQGQENVCAPREEQNGPSRRAEGTLAEGQFSPSPLKFHRAVREELFPDDSFEYRRTGSLHEGVVLSCR